MKKFLLVAAVMVVASGTAFGSSLSVPWFLDNAPPTDGVFPPSANSGTWITITNNTDLPISTAITYRDSDVADATPANNTFILPAFASFSFRPVGDDSVTEVGGSIVPNMASPLNRKAGSAKISWVGGPADIQGRLVQTDAGGVAIFAYLLPPGF